MGFASCQDNFAQKTISLAVGPKNTMAKMGKATYLLHGAKLIAILKAIVGQVMITSFT